MTVTIDAVTSLTPLFSRPVVTTSPEEHHVLYSFKLKPLQTFNTTYGHCWTSLFDCGVVAKRNIDRDSGPGLAVSFHLMVKLATLEIPVSVDDGTVLVGYRTAAIPIARKGNCVLWHLETSKAGQIDPGRLASTQTSWHKVKDYKELADLQCILGWCQVAHVMLGTQDIHEEVRWSRARSQGRTLHWTGINFTGHLMSAAPLQIGAQFSVTYTFVMNRQTFPATTVYSQMLRDTSREVAVVIDSDAERAWLVPKLSLILHMSHMYIRHRRIQVNPIPYAAPHPDGAEAAESALLHAGNTVILPSQGRDILRLRELLLGLNINLINSKPVLEESRERKVFGVELMDLITQPPSGGKMKRVEPNRSAGRWACIANGADAVVICAGIGEAIKPAAGNSGLNQRCVSLPIGYYYLAAPLRCLEIIVQRQGDDLEQLQSGSVRLAHARSWAISGDPFQQCSHPAHNAETCWDSKDLFQEPYQKGRWSALTGQVSTYPSVSPTHLNNLMNGAVVFGRRQQKRD
ncbi:MAG: hypothetical protein M1837_000725 [Sclerophora amabilis]|nr:MAG: hypothetical protein M1837_000725 [Sclerophora amabilis]